MGSSPKRTGVEERPDNRRKALEQHYADLRRELKVWFEYEFRDVLNNAMALDPQMQALENLAAHEAEKPPAPDQPEPLYNLYAARRLGIHYLEGGLYDQPYITVQEFMICIEEEDAAKARVANIVAYKAAQHAN